jgi:REP-associated tyrosine transposase
MVKELFHSKKLRQHRHAGSGTFFVTKCLAPRMPLFQLEQRKIIADALAFYADQDKISLAAFVVMPDHWHAVFASNQDIPVSQVITALQVWIAKHTGEYLRQSGSFWQKGFHEKRIRSSQQFNYICNYIEYNPVDKGYADSPDAWDASSANRQYIDKMLCPWPWRFEND